MTLKEISNQLALKQLNLDKVLKLEDGQRMVILSLFDTLMNLFRMNDGFTPDLVRITMLYNTLVDNDYLVTRRERNIDNILDNESQD